MVKDCYACRNMRTLTGDAAALCGPHELAAVRQERDALADRVRALEDRVGPIDPGGTDRIDELESANGFLRARIERLEKDAILRQGIPFSQQWALAKEIATHATMVTQSGLPHDSEHGIEEYRSIIDEYLLGRRRLCERQPT